MFVCCLISFMPTYQSHEVLTSITLDNFMWLLSSQGRIYLSAAKNSICNVKKWSFIYLFTYLFISNSHPRIWGYVFLLILERRRWGESERERERERDINVKEKHWLFAYCMHPKWGSNLQHRYPDRESNLQPFCVLDDAPTNRPTWLGLNDLF